MESVQYFQFDSEGNMYVFQPGSGFSGPSVRVEPGFEIEDFTQEGLFTQSDVSSNMMACSVETCQVKTERGKEIVVSTAQKRFLLFII